MSPWRTVTIVVAIGLAQCAKPDREHAPPGGNATMPANANATMPASGSATMPAMDHSAHGSAAPKSTKATLPVGYAAVTVDPARAAAMGLATAPVEERELTRALRAAGVVTLDETRTAHVHAKVRGWVEGIHVDFVGRKVKKGEALCSIYSQEVYAAEIELLSILERTGTAPDQLLDAARRRLELWDVPKSEIARLVATREPQRTFPLLAPRAGTVVAKEALQGMYVDPSIELYTLSDLSKVWVVADVYEAEVPYVRIGDRARLTVEGQASIDARVTFMAPTLDEATRTRKIRVEVEGSTLLPGAFVTAELPLMMGRALVVPESAVIRTGPRSIVFIAHGENAEHLEPREIKLGPLVGDVYRVDEGLRAGDRVAIGAQFLLDSESRLRATSGAGGGHAH